MKQMMAWVLLLLTATTSLVHAAKSDISYAITAGYNGVVTRNGGIFPVEIILENKVASTVGLIEIRQKDIGGRTEITQALPINLPSPSSKRFIILTRIKSGASGSINVTIQFDDYINTVRQTINLNTTTKPMILGIGVPKTYLASKELKRYSLVKVTEQNLNTDPVCLGSVHALMVMGSNFSRFTTEQIDDISTWIGTGGRLIVINPLEDPTFKRLFKRVVGETPFDPFQESAKRIGAGYVFSSMKTNLKTTFWNKNENLIMQALPLSAWSKKRSKLDTMVNTGDDGESYFQSLWETRNSYGASGFFALLFIVVAYILAIGPLDAWIVKKTGKPQHTWVLLVIFITLFSVIAYLYSSFVNIGTMRAVYANVLDVSLDHEVAEGNGMLWVYSAKNKRYHLSTPVANVHFSAQESGLGSATMSGVTIEGGLKPSINARIPIFSAKEFDATWREPWPHRISETIDENNGKHRFTVPEELDIKTAYLADNSGLRQLERTADGEFQTASLTMWDNLSPKLDALNLDPNNFNYGRQTSTMPSSKTLEDYLIWISFPQGFPDPYNQWFFDMNNGMSFQKTNFRERALSAKHRVQQDGRVLLLFTKNKSLLPIDIQGGAPSPVQANLIRVQLPPLK